MNKFADALHEHNLKLFVAIDPAYNGVPNSELFYYIYHPYMNIDLDYIMVMAYEGYYSSNYPYDFIGAVQSILSATGQYLSINQIQIILSTTNPNTNAPFTQEQMSERINYVQQNGIYALGIWSMSGQGGFPTSENLWYLISNYESNSSTFATYTVTFTESGLPSGTSWSVTLNGASKSSTTTTVSFTGIANGSYSYTVGVVSGYTASPSSGTISVNGANVNQAITFTASSTISFKPDDIVQVIWSAINVRTGPGLSYGIVGTENYGSQGLVGFGNPVSNDGYLWVPISYNDGLVGWSASEGLSVVGQGNNYYESDNFWPSSIVVVSVTSLNVRTGPGTSYSVITSEPYGQTGTVEFGNMVDANGYVWVPILYSDGILGWSALPFLTPNTILKSSYPQAGYYYVVQSGDTLWNIAYEAYGNGALYYLIMDANGLQSTTIYAGENLYIPI